MEERDGGPADREREVAFRRGDISLDDDDEMCYLFFCHCEQIL